MALRFRQPRETDLAALLARCAGDSLTYSPVGGSLDGVTPQGLRRHRWIRALPSDAFERAREAIREWAVHRESGLTVVADGPVAAGANVAMSAPLPIGFVDVTCRVVAVIDEPERYAFAYGTLAVHPEKGEESFLVRRDEDGVRFEVEAISAPRLALARLIPPLTDRLQDAAVQRYLAAITKLVST